MKKRTGQKMLLSWLSCLLWLLTPPAPTQQFRLNWVGQVPLQGNARDLLLHHNYLYVALHDGGLGVVDVAHPERPQLIRYLQDRLTPLSLHGSDDFLYVADRFNGIQILSIANPCVPRLVATLNTPGIVNSVTVRGDLLFAACGSAGLHIYKQHGEHTYLPLGSFTKVDYTKRVSLYRHFALLADNYTRGFKVLDLQDPENPALVASAFYGSFCDTLLLSPPSVLLGNRRRGVIFLELASLPLLKARTAILKYNNSIRDLLQWRNFLFTADNENGVAVYDLSALPNPRLLERADTPGWSVKLLIKPPYLFVADWHEGLAILRMTCSP